ncbi:hypothetical protein D9M72_643570 [compost metagenome]
MMPGRLMGNTTWRNTCRRLAPRVAAASSKLRDTPRIALAIGNTASGKAVCTRPISTPFWLYSIMIGRLIRPSPIRAWLSMPAGPRITSQP